MRQCEVCRRAPAQLVLVLNRDQVMQYVCLACHARAEAAVEAKERAEAEAKEAEVPWQETNLDGGGDGH